MKRIMFFFCFCVYVQGAIFNVSNTKELRDALSIANSTDTNDTIYLSEGTYKTTEDSLGTFNVKNAILIGSKTGDTILDGDDTYTVVYAENSILQNLVITNGKGGSLYRASGIDGENYTIINSKIIHNHNKYGSWGAGVHSHNKVNVINSLFYDNSGSLWGGNHIYSNYGENNIINSIFIGGGGSSIYINAEYDSELGFFVSGEGKVSNNVFIDYSGYDFLEDEINHYLLSEVQDIFVDFDNEDYRLNESSPLINAGTTDIKKDIALPSMDFIGNLRVYENKIDVGPYEFNENSSLQISLKDKLLSLLTEEEVNTILPVINAEMELKISKATEFVLEEGKQYVLNNLSEFNLTNNIFISKTINKCKNNPLSCGIKVVSDLNKKFVDALPLSDWSLVGTGKEINDMSIFDNAYIVWIFNNGEWNVYSPIELLKEKIDDNFTTITKIPANSGIWILKPTILSDKQIVEHIAAQINSRDLPTDLKGTSVTFIPESPKEELYFEQIYDVNITVTKGMESVTTTFSEMVPSFFIGIEASLVDINISSIGIISQEK